MRNTYAVCEEERLPLNGFTGVQISQDQSANDNSIQEFRWYNENSDKAQNCTALSSVLKSSAVTGMNVSRYRTSVQSFHAIHHVSRSIGLVVLF